MTAINVLPVPPLNFSIFPPLVPAPTPGVPPASHPQGLVFVRYTVLAFYLGTFVFGLIGNTLVLYVVVRYSDIRTRSVQTSNYYIWNLALADELFVLALPFFCYATWTGDWIFGNITCKVMYVFRECNKFASVFTLCALSIDRFLAAFHQLGRYRQIRVGIAVCVGIWALCLATSAPYWMFGSTVPPVHPAEAAAAAALARFRATGNASAMIRPELFRGVGEDDVACVAGIWNVFEPEDEKNGAFANASSSSSSSKSISGSGRNCSSIGRFLAELASRTATNRNSVGGGGGSGYMAEKASCRLYWPSIAYRRYWTYCQLVLGLLLPLVAIAIFNALLLRRLRALNASASARRARPASGASRLAAPPEVVTAAGSSRMRRLTSATRMVLAVVAIFVIGQLPYHVVELISIQIEASGTLPNKRQTEVFIICNMLAQIIVFVSSCCNPVVYGIFNKNYRKLYKQTLFSSCCTAVGGRSASQRPTSTTVQPARTRYGPSGLHPPGANSSLQRRRSATNAAVAMTCTAAAYVAPPDAAVTAAAAVDDNKNVNQTGSDSPDASERLVPPVRHVFHVRQGHHHDDDAGGASTVAASSPWKIFERVANRALGRSASKSAESRSRSAVGGAEQLLGTELQLDGRSKRVSMGGASDGSAGGTSTSANQRGSVVSRRSPVAGLSRGMSVQRSRGSWCNLDSRQSLSNCSL